MTNAAPASGDERRRGGPPAWFAVVAIVGLLLAVALIAAQALGIGTRNPGPPPTMPPTGEAAQYTRDLLALTLSKAGFQVRDPQTPYRPGESPSLVDVPRRAVQVVLPQEPDQGYVMIYELPTAGEADRLGKGLAAYLASGPGAVQYPRDSQFVIRRVGPTLVFFWWSENLTPDPEMARLASVLETFGEPLTRS